MTIKDIMQIGTKGMSKAQKEAEQERRIAVSERINLLQVRVIGCESAARECAKGSNEAKSLNNRVKGYKRELNRIKAEESVWLREAAWFMYA